jgi:hypothetical protein
MFFADFAEDLEAVAAREVVVEDQCVDGAAGEVLGEIGAAGEGDYRELAAVRGAEEVEKRLIIIDVKNGYSPRFSSILLDSPRFSSILLDSPSFSHGIFLLLLR